MGLLEGKTALVTGGSRGIGKSIVEKFAREGAAVAFTYRSSAEKAEEIVNNLKKEGHNIFSYRSDAADHQAAEKLTGEVVKDLGGLEIVVNNAGINADNLLLRMNEEQWDQVINVNLKSVFNISKYAVKPMMRNRKGSFIHLSSVVGEQGNAGQSNYAASKSGIFGFSKSLAKELGSRNIRSNVIAPGFIKTEMTGDLDENTLKEWMEQIPLKRSGESEDVANTALFLASDLSSYITGQTLNVCGGMVM